MKKLISLLFCLALLQGCATARGALEAARSLGGGLIDDAQGMMEGVQEREQQRQRQSDSD